MNRLCPDLLPVKLKARMDVRSVFEPCLFKAAGRQKNTPTCGVFFSAG